MDEELVNDQIIPAETEVPTPDETPTAADPNTKAIEYIGKFAPEMPTTTPEEIIAGLVACLDITSIPYDQFYDVAVSSKEAAAFMYDLKESGDPIKALVRNYDTEEIQAAMQMMDEDDQYEEDRIAYRKKLDTTKSYAKLQEDNMKISQTGAEEFLNEINPSPEEETAFIAFTDEFLMDAADNLMTKAHWMELWQAFKYKGDVAMAEENGKIIGKNEKITSGKKTREDLKDLLPANEITANVKPEAMKRNLIVPRKEFRV